MDWVNSDGIGFYEWTTAKGERVANRDFFAAANGRERGARTADMPLAVQNKPWVFLTTRPPGNVIEPHFHEVPQYQIFVEGYGRIGKHAVQPIEVHYTDAYTPYGPIVASDAGLAFVTLRSKANNGGAHYMPQSRSMLARKAGRALTAHAEVGSGAGSQELIPLTDDGVEALMLALQADESAVPKARGPNSGRFLLVLGGGLARDGQEFGRYSCIFLAGDERPTELHAGSSGAQVLSLQLPVGGNMADTDSSE